VDLEMFLANIDMNRVKYEGLLGDLKQAALTSQAQDTKRVIPRFLTGVKII
jgi:hypothetical protein